MTGWLAGWVDPDENNASLALTTGSDNRAECGNNTSGGKVFYVGHHDPRVPHPRKLISKNYHLLANHPVASKLFPR